MYIYEDRYERNNFFVGVDPRILDSSQQRIFNVESPYTSGVPAAANQSLLGASFQRPKTASS